MSLSQFKITITLFYNYCNLYLHQVIGGEEQGIPVAIGHVTPEGPAEGLLQIYDEIRSVNGEFIVVLTSMSLNLT